MTATVGDRGYKESGVDKPTDQATVPSRFLGGKTSGAKKSKIEGMQVRVTCIPRVEATTTPPFLTIVFSLTEGKRIIIDARTKIKNCYTLHRS